ncbi:MAG TPA: hypothetical protein VK775_17360 [Chthoniobacterales bacterium]|jgi:hypothetical protein|nr:hypothetical protein [Chthoniobacterales bacterium]
MRSNYRDQHVAFTNGLLDCFNVVCVKGYGIDTHEDLISTKMLGQQVAQSYR